MYILIPNKITLFSENYILSVKRIAKNVEKSQASD